MKIKVIMLLMVLFITKEGVSQYIYSTNTWFSESFNTGNSYELFSQIGNSYQQIISNEYTVISSSFWTNNFSETLSVSKKLFADDVSIYPNPVQNELFIQVKENGFSYKFYDLNGKEIGFVGNIAPNKTERILLSSFKTGIYVVKLISSDGRAAYIKILKL